MERMPASGRLAGIDYGTVRIGIAITDPGRRLASPYENYTRGDRHKDARRFQRLVEEDEVVGFVVGLPVHSSGDESEKSREAREFGRWLHEVTRRPVEFFDERFSTRQAQQLLAPAGFTRKRRKQRLDMIAAQAMLEAYLQSGASEHEPGALDD